MRTFTEYSMNELRMIAVKTKSLTKDDTSLGHLTEAIILADKFTDDGKYKEVEYIMKVLRKVQLGIELALNN